AHPATHSFPTRRSSDLQLGRLERRRRIRHPAVEHAWDVVVTFPHVLRDLDDAVVVRRPHRTQRQLFDGCQCATPESATPPSYTRSEEHTSELQSLAYLV